MGVRGGGNHCNWLDEETPPERGHFPMLEVYERVEISKLQ